ncbi:hypothetical protein HID58_051285 [Brassica napus]|uniref:Uncharacterized protein n=1 Tax=Brassica napus TaxID=3708 RepID=A0ABQ8A8K3_BRANA|nr:hypothetical protein HID58_051285 [Brassica napus]
MTGDMKVNGGEIDESKVKAPNMFERAKEEFDAVVGAVHQRKSSKDESDQMEFKSEKPEDENKKPNMMRKAKEEIKSLSDDIDENTHVDEVKAPNVFERAKEEIEAVIDTIHSKKKETDGSYSPKRSRSVSPEKERAGFGCSLGKGLEKICAPWGNNKND